LEGQGLVDYCKIWAALGNAKVDKVDRVDRVNKD